MSARLALAGLLAAAAAAGAGPPPGPTPLQTVERRQAVVAPAIDGLMLGGVRLGTAEAVLVRQLGPPGAVRPSSLGDRTLAWELVPGLVLEVHLAGGEVGAIVVAATAGDPPPGSPRTTRGIGLGAPVADVLARYGPAAGDHLWYAEAGVAFNLDAADTHVRSIAVFPRGTPPP